MQLLLNGLKLKRKKRSFDSKFMKKSFFSNETLLRKIETLYKIEKHPQVFDAMFRNSNWKTMIMGTTS